MIKRTPLLFLFTLIVVTLSGQNFGGWGTNHLYVASYDGVVSPGALTLRIDYSGTNLYEPAWKLSVKVKNPFKSGNVLFPVEKFQLVSVRTEGQANNPGPLPTIQQIGMPSPVCLNNMSEVFLVPSSNAPLENMSQWNSYYDLRIIFNLIITGGGYLEKIQKKFFRGSLLFTAWRQDNTPIGSKEIPYFIRIGKLSGNPPSDEYSISFTTEATNAQVDLKSMADYINGKRVTYPDGMTISATTDYQVTVRSVETFFSSPSGNTLPLDIINLQLTGRSGSSLPIHLSAARRTILQGQSTNGLPESYDVIYFTDPNDSRLLDVSCDQCSTQLMFEVTPL